MPTGSLERPLRPLGIVGGEISPLSIIKTRKYVEKLVARGYLPPDLTQGFIEYQSVSRARAPTGEHTAPLPSLHTHLAHHPVLRLIVR